MEATPLDVKNQHARNQLHRRESSAPHCCGTIELESAANGGSFPPGNLLLNGPSTVNYGLGDLFSFRIAEIVPRIRSVTLYEGETRKS